MLNSGKDYYCCGVSDSTQIELAKILVVYITQSICHC